MNTREMIIGELREDLGLALKTFKVSPEITREILNRIDGKLAMLSEVTPKELVALSEPIKKQRLLETLITFQNYLKEKNGSMKNLVTEDGKLK